MARTRGKNILLILILTIPFSYLVTLVLALLPTVDKEQETSISGTVAAIFYVLLLVGVCVPLYQFMVTNAP